MAIFVAPNIKINNNDEKKNKIIVKVNLPLFREVKASCKRQVNALPCFDNNRDIKPARTALLLFATLFTNDRIGSLIDFLRYPFLLKYYYKI
ncbi:MAG: hypothetical protein EIB84_06560 [Spiroplasma poulsonii]|uniref:hypothetical protein n=1 Tax=Spiroplasma poulsonii TaxID=2138 RepID=UPI0006950C67|nr:hypothetical protein [Spiroplasma poulsonii]MBW1242416.1 hypothetical protein [Spiroplasma poulsonii]